MKQTPRRGNRVKKPSFRAQEAQWNHQFETIVLSNVSTSSSEDTPVISQYGHDKIDEREIFGFKTRQNLQEIIQSNVETPQILRTRIKERISKHISDENSSHSSDDSNYEPVSINSSDSEELTSESSEETPQAIFNNQLPKTKQRKCKGKQNYTIKTDDYFSHKASKKSHTSNHTLAKLNNPHLPQNELNKFLKTASRNDKHSKYIEELINSYEHDFDTWILMMNECFNVLLYGLGSKKIILQHFHSQYLNDVPVMVINGFFPSLTLKDLCDGVMNLTAYKEAYNLQDFTRIVDEQLRLHRDEDYYLIIHNIEMIKIAKFQLLLPRLISSNSNIHLLASIDHVNAPLIWDYSTLSELNFTWWDCTTFRTYNEETGFETSMMAHQNATLTLSSLRNVFLSLTPNSKRIYLILVKYQLEHFKQSQIFDGLSVNDLYTMCREQFLVSTDLALRAQLNEFLDHKMIRMKRSTDGSEQLIAPIANNLLQQFVDEKCVF